MAENRPENLVSMFFTQARRLKNRPFLWSKHQGAYRAMDWTSVANHVAALARGLRSIGLEPGSRVVLVAENRPEWLIADVAIMAAGGISVPAYVTNTEADHYHILENSGATGIIVSTERLARRLLPAAVRSGDLRFMIVMEPFRVGQISNIEIFRWDDVLARGDGELGNIAEAAEHISRYDTACIIYTSGTGGAPKGVMLQHNALLHNCEGARDALAALGLENEVYMSFLPLSHSFEHTAGQFFPITIGAEIYYAEGIESLGTNMLEARPTLMTAVPRLCDILYDKITRGVHRASAVKQRMFLHALDLGKRRYHAPGSFSLADRLIDAVLDRTVRRKVQGVFGGRLKALVSGGAALNPEVGLFFHALGVQILQGYGQTEAGPVISVNRPSKAKMHTVGPALKNVTLRLAEDGEILVQGDMVMQGYWRNASATRAVLRGGWLYTGDIGEIDADGHLQITDRKKDIIVISGGDNISPARIEGLLALEPELTQAMVSGDNRAHLVAVLVPSEGWMKEWARAVGKPADLQVLCRDPAFHREVAAAVERVNARLAPIEKIRRFIIAPEPFSIENDQMTPTQKIRRHVIRRQYQDALDALYV
ncbi:MAG: AMP-dependent synthetase/ligase [Hyphomicrobium sp.]